MPRPLTRRQAERVREIVIEYFRVFCYDEHGNHLPDRELPRLFEPGHNGTGWDLAWEGYGPYDWPTLVSGGGRDEYGAVYRPATFPAVVLAEPINGCELGLYRA